MGQKKTQQEHMDSNSDIVSELKLWNENRKSTAQGIDHLIFTFMSKVEESPLSDYVQIDYYTSITAQAMETLLATLKQFYPDIVITFEGSSKIRPMLTFARFWTTATIDMPYINMSGKFIEWEAKRKQLIDKAVNGLIRDFMKRADEMPLVTREIWFHVETKSIVTGHRQGFIVYSISDVAMKMAMEKMKPILPCIKIERDLITNHDDLREYIIVFRGF